MRNRYSYAKKLDVAAVVIVVVAVAVEYDVAEFLADVPVVDVVVVVDVATVLDVVVVVDVVIEDDVIIVSVVIVKFIEVDVVVVDVVGVLASSIILPCLVSSQIFLLLMICSETWSPKEYYSSENGKIFIKTSRIEKYSFYICHFLPLFT